MHACLIPLGEGQPYRLEKRITVVGRRKFICDMYLPDRRVSQLHCVIRRTDDGDLVVRDMGSTNGTRVNGRKVTEGTLLPGDELTFAAAKFRVEVRAMAGAEGAAGRSTGTAPRLSLPVGSSTGSSLDEITESGQHEATDRAGSSGGGSAAGSFDAAEFPIDDIGHAEASRMNDSDEHTSHGDDSGEPETRHPRRIESVKAAAKSDSHAAINTLRAETQSDYARFLPDDDFEPDAEGNTDIMRLSDVPHSAIEEFPPSPPAVDASPYRCGECQSVYLVRAPLSWWQSPLVLMNLGIYCCPRCFRRSLHGRS